MYTAIKSDAKNHFHKIDVIYNEKDKPNPKDFDFAGIFDAADRYDEEENKWLKSCQIIPFQDREDEAKVITHVWRNFIYKTETDKIEEDTPNKIFFSQLDKGIKTDCIEIVFSKVENGFTRAYFKEPILIVK